MKSFELAEQRREAREKQEVEVMINLIKSNPKIADKLVRKDV